MKIDYYDAQCCLDLVDGNLTKDWGQNDQDNDSRTNGM